MAFIQQLRRPPDLQVYVTTEDLGVDYFRELPETKLKKRSSLSDLAVASAKRPKLDSKASEAEKIERRRQDALIMVIKAGWSLHQGEDQIIQFDEDEDGKTDIIAYDYNEDGEWDKYKRV